MLPVPGASCGLKQLQCHATDKVIVRVDRDGHVTEAFIEGQRSATTDACILAEVRQSSFEPARECDGDPLPGEFSEDYGIACTELF
jgi:hypothetical protein